HLFAQVRISRQLTGDSVVGEDEDRDVVLADLVDQFRARNLAHIDHASAEQSVISSLQLGQVEGEGDLPLKPGLDRMTVGRDDVHRICAGEGGNVEIRNFAEHLPPMKVDAGNVEPDVTGYD